MNCRLCNSAGCNELFSDKIRSYFHCEKCGLIFVPECGHVSIEEEIKRYALHENSPDHEGYVGFLSDLVSIVIKQSPVNGRILDYGSGQRAVLTGLLQGRGYNCTAYDPLYKIGNDALAKTYDTVVLCEVIEHLRDLPEELSIIKKAAGRTGTIIIRTRIHPLPEHFAGWWYKNDITHINFFSGVTIDTLAAMLGREKSQNDELSGDIFVFRGRE
jgi:hypothetical protein